jgi:hypothetical protein
MLSCHSGDNSTSPIRTSFSKMKQKESDDENGTNYRQKIPKDSEEKPR